MLPKVATHFLHTTSRAAAQAVQAPLRNVFQTGSSGTSNLGNWNGTGSSNWGGHGTGTGSAKQNTGSRYYSSFNTAGRAVSQANAVAANDGSFTQSDDNDDHLSRRVVVIQTHSGSSTKRSRIRSSSVSLTKAESLGVLKTLQLQGRSRFLHTSIEAAPQPHRRSVSPLTPSRPRRNSTSSSDGLDRPLSPVRNFSDSVADSGSPPLPESLIRPRRNSISSTGDLDASTIELTDPALEQISEKLWSRRNSASSSDQSQQSEQSSIDTQSTTPAQSPVSPQPSHTSHDTSRPPAPLPSSQFSYLIDAKESGDVHHVAEAVARFRLAAADATVWDFNFALEALLSTRAGESSMPMLEVYNDMIKHSVHPDTRTYTLLFSSLTARDAEIHSAIQKLEGDKRHIELFGTWDGATTEKVEHRMNILWLEQKSNFNSIVSLFAIARTIPGHYSVRTYGQVLRSCVHSLNVDAALEVFRHAELKVEQLRPQFYESLIELYGKVKLIGAAERVFNRYMAAGRQNGLYLQESDEDFVKRHISVWNAMIGAYFESELPDKAIGLLDQMMNSPAGVDFSYADPPLPASATYTRIIKGFCAIGDVRSALTWYRCLQEQGVTLNDSYLPSDKPITPSINASLAMVDALAAAGLISELNELFPTFRLESGYLYHVPRYIYSANMNALANITDPQVAKEILGFLQQQVVSWVPKRYGGDVAMSLALQYIRRGFLEESCKLYSDFLNQRFSELEAADSSPEEIMQLRRGFSRFAGAHLQVAIAQDRLTADMASSILQMACVVGLSYVSPGIHKALLHAYGVARLDNQFPMKESSPEDWRELLRIAFRASQSVPFDSPATSSSLHINVPNSAFAGIFCLVEDLARCQVDIAAFPQSLIEQTIQHLISLYGPQSIIGAFERFGPVFKHVLDSSETIKSLASGDPVESKDPRPQRTSSNMTFSDDLTKQIDFLLRQSNVKGQVMAAYIVLQKNLKQRKIPILRTLGKVIQGLGRHGQTEKLYEVYEIAQEGYKSLMLSQNTLREAWICVEDSMIIALAHAGEVEKAHVHRLKLLEQGATPSADAYGALILYVKDTTDDVSNALVLFQEAVEVGARMNIYLYNNIISKLAKARKADHALELFQRMKDQGIRPSSITYGALIGACARVGDVESSEALFAEMVEQPNFKPRIPPYNTMMQLFTMTKPNRAKALLYYQELIAAGIRPAAHTYKLLLDAYGSIEPVDIASMEAIFNDLQNDPHVEVQGTHYASLINAYGCVQRDLDKAIATFDSVPKAALDAVVFESLINVFVSHRRTDIMPEYIAKMTTAGVHMTAYIANFLIKGYAIVGELDKARDIFESLIDPPTGVAAPHNHAPHEPGTEARVPWMEPVYREPSTWEAMIRAELGAGNRDRALDLLERLKSRQYPEAVFNRIGGVMVDHSSLSPSFSPIQQHE